MTQLHTRHTTAARLHDEPDFRERRIPDLIKELRDETTDLMREELALARTEIGEKVSRAMRNVVYLGVGGLIAVVGLVFLLAAAVAAVEVALIAAGVAIATASWLAPLIFGVVVIVIGYALAQKAISTLRHEKLYPEKTAASMRANAHWAREKMR